MKSLNALQRAMKTQREEQQHSFGDLNATELYCPKCKRAMPVRERLLLVLPSGDLYDYCCKGCGTSVGNRTA